MEFILRCLSSWHSKRKTSMSCWNWNWNMKGFLASSRSSFLSARSSLRRASSWSSFFRSRYDGSCTEPLKEWQLSRSYPTAVLRSLTICGSMSPVSVSSCALGGSCTSTAACFLSMAKFSMRIRHHHFRIRGKSDISMKIPQSTEPVSCCGTFLFLISFHGPGAILFVNLLQQNQTEIF